MKLTHTFVLVVLSIFFIECNCNCGEEDIDLKVHMKFGYANEVNTFKNYLIKDLIVDGTADTTFYFTPEQKNVILNKANEVNFFDMPKFIESTAEDRERFSQTEQMLRIKIDKWDHTVKWSYPIGNSKQEEDIKKLSYFIIDLILDSPEYKALPEVKDSHH